MRVGSLFSGIGGLDLGLERAGMEVVWQVENDPYCIRVLEKHWPSVQRYGDVKELDPAILAPVDLICGGFPCQPVSTAGGAKRKGVTDDRWLWPDFSRIVCGVRPAYVIVENVPGLRSRGMGGVLGDLSLFGYDAEWQTIPASAFGAPHLRKRLFIVAYSNGNGRASVFPPERSLQVTPHSEWEYQTTAAGWPNFQYTTGRPSPWRVEPRVGRVADGVPSRVDRLRSLGNAVVPQVAEWVGGRILQCE